MEITINGQPVTALDITTDEGGITMRLSRLGLGLGVLPSGPIAYAYASVIAVGDSITAGVTYPSFMVAVSDSWGATLDNNGSSGSILQNGNLANGSPQSINLLGNFTARSVTPTAEALVCAYGFNDGRYIGTDGAGNGYPDTLSPALYAAGLRSACRRWLAIFGRDKIWIVTPHYISDVGLTTFGADSNFSGQSRAGFEAYVTACRDVAAEFGLKLVDTYAAGAPSTTIDNLHPDEAGIAEIVALFTSPSSATLAASTGAITGGVETITVGTGLTAYLVSGGTETALSVGSNAASVGAATVCWRETGNRWELAAVTVTAPASQLLLNATPANNVGFTVNSSSASATDLTGTTTRNSITWAADTWPVGTRVQFTITTGSSLRVISRHNLTNTLSDSSSNQNIYDATVSGSVAVDVTTTRSDCDFFGFLTVSTGNFAISSFVVTFP
jgi:hypothetical protein